MSLAGGEQIQREIHRNIVGSSIIRADSDLVQSIVLSERWISKKSYPDDVEYESLRQLIERRGRGIGRKRALQVLADTVLDYCLPTGTAFEASMDSGFIWSSGNAIDHSVMFHEAAAALVEIFPACRIVLVTDEAEACAERIVEDWSGFLDAIAETTPEKAAWYGEVQVSVRRAIALNWCHAQKAVIDSLHGGPCCITMPPGLMESDKGAALRLIGLID